MIERQQHIAYHEAGHAVMAVLLGRDVQIVSLASQQTVLNSERLHTLLAATGPLSTKDREYCEEEVKVALAGWGGEVTALGQVSSLVSYDDDLSMANLVQRALRERAGRVASRNGLPNEVLNVLRENRDALDRLAKALLEEGELLAERVRELVRRPS